MGTVPRRRGQVLQSFLQRARLLQPARYDRSAKNSDARDTNKVGFDEVTNFIENIGEIAETSDHVRVYYVSYVAKKPHENWWHAR